jgi:hypothetical protein
MLLSCSGLSSPVPIVNDQQVAVEATLVLRQPWSVQEGPFYKGYDAAPSPEADPQGEEVTPNLISEFGHWILVSDPASGKVIFVEAKTGQISHAAQWHQEKRKIEARWLVASGAVAWIVYHNGQWMAARILLDGVLERAVPVQLPEQGRVSIRPDGAGGLALIYCSIEDSQLHLRKYIWNAKGDTSLVDDRRIDFSSNWIRILDVADTEQGYYILSITETFERQLGAVSRTNGSISTTTTVPCAARILGVGKDGRAWLDCDELKGVPQLALVDMSASPPVQVMPNLKSVIEDASTSVIALSARPAVDAYWGVSTQQSYAIYRVRVSN